MFRGRHLLADRDLPPGQQILVSDAYLTTVLPSWKKRICRGCFTAHPGRLTIKCGYLYLNMGQVLRSCARRRDATDEPPCLLSIFSSVATRLLILIQKVVWYFCRSVQSSMVLLPPVPGQPCHRRHSRSAMPSPTCAGLPSAQLLWGMQMRC